MQASVVAAHRLSCSLACGIFPDQGSNLCTLHWQADAYPLHHQGNPFTTFCPTVRSMLGLPWCSSLRIYFPMQGTRVQSLVRELRSHRPQGESQLEKPVHSNKELQGPSTAKKKKTKVSATILDDICSDVHWGFHGIRFLVTGKM